MKRRDQITHKILQRSHLEDRGYRDPETGEKSLCRIWDGPTSGSEDKTRGHGYGRMNLDGATVAVHIAAWVNENGLIPPRKQLDHLCRQRDCCEERHLKLKTHKQNQRNKAPKAAPPPEHYITRILRLYPGIGAGKLKMIHDQWPPEMIERAVLDCPVGFFAHYLNSMKGIACGQDIENELRAKLKRADYVRSTHPLELEQPKPRIVAPYDAILCPGIDGNGCDYCGPIGSGLPPPPTTIVMSRQMFEHISGAIIGHDIPAERLPPPAPEVTDE